jgi:hypothetical protein
MTGGSATDRLKEMTSLGWSVVVAVEETEGEEDAGEGKIGLDSGFLSGCEVNRSDGEVVLVVAVGCPGKKGY